MVKEYSCKKCGKIFKQKGHYTSHKNRKNPCININEIVENKININLKKIYKNVVLQIPENMEVNTFIELYDLLQKYDSKKCCKMIKYSIK